MVNVMPDVVGLDVTGVYYRYTIGKDPAADALVYVQNENALGSGYIFRETDDWSGLAGNTSPRPFLSVTFRCDTGASVQLRSKAKARFRMRL